MYILRCNSFPNKESNIPVLITQHSYGNNPDDDEGLRATMNSKVLAPGDCMRVRTLENVQVCPLHPNSNGLMPLWSAANPDGVISDSTYVDIYKKTALSQ